VEADRRNHRWRSSCAGRAGLLPDEKVDVVRDQAAAGQRLLFVGDGVNDAPALAAAHVGVAMGRSGSDLSVATADAVIVRDDLSTVPAVVELARRARRLVVANLVVAATFIAVLVSWDLFGILSLPLGVAGHEGSTCSWESTGCGFSDAAWSGPR
jgi:P-type E1-E2 ATPase